MKRSAMFKALVFAALLGPWSVAALAADLNDRDSLSLRVKVADIYPPAPVTDLQGQAGAEGQALLEWTAPDESAGVAPKAVPVVSYSIRAATFSAADLGGDTTAWFTLSTPVANAPAPQVPGSLQAALTSLAPGVTFYFGLKSTDDMGLVSDVDSRLKLLLNQAKVAVKGIDGVTDLRALPGGVSGSVALTWTHPRRVGQFDPTSYDVRVSSLGQIQNNAQFTAAQPLSALSSSPVAATGAPGGQAAMAVTGLYPGTTYYFAVRQRDAGSFIGVWVRNVPADLNPDNFAPAHLILNEPDPVTDLAAVITGVPGQVRLTWTAPRNPNFVAVSTYTLKVNIQSIAELGGDTTAWFNLATSTVVIVTPAKVPGGLETLYINGLPENQSYFFGIKAQDATGQVSDLDSRAHSVVDQAKVVFPFQAMPLTAVPGPVSGSVALSWTEPVNIGLTLPMFYRVRVSSTANMDDSPAFEAALPLSALSSSPVPAPTPGGGGPSGMVVTGLLPGTTYFFAVRLTDSHVPANQSAWTRDVGLGLNVNNFAPAHFSPRAPDQVTDLTALPGAAEGDVALSWTAPRNQNFVPMASYVVRFANFSVASLGGDTTAWFNAAASSSVAKAPAQSFGSLETLLIQGLEPNTTFYFGVRSLDERGETSALDVRAYGPQAFTRPRNLAPAAPSGLTGVAGLRKALMSWSPLTPAEKGLDFARFQLYRSTDPVNGFVRVATTTALALTDRPLTAFTTYYFKLSAIDLGTNESALTSTAAVTPFTLVPMEPFALRVNPSSSTITVKWTPTTRFADGTPFDDASSPAADELQGYSIRRSTEICLPLFTFLSSATVAQSSHTDTHNGNPYYYQIKSFNTLGYSTATLVLSTLGEQSYFVDDCATRVILTDLQTQALSAVTNGLGADIQLSRRRRPEDVGEGLMQSVEFRAMLNGVTEVKNFHFDKPARVSLHFNAVGGAPAPDTTPMGVQAAGGGMSVAAQGAAMKNLGMYWHNGAEFKKLYGTVDAQAQTVTVQTPNMGQFQIRSLFRSQNAVFDLSNISARVITPNDDGLNDTLIFGYDPGPNNVVPAGSVYDVKGGFVAHMVGGLVPNTLTWDGKMNGKAVTSGVYVYQIKGDGKTFNGTIVVAR